MEDTALYKEIMKETTDIPSGKEVSQLTPIEHAKRILELGSDRAKLLHQFHQTNICKWSHVDWDYVEEELKK